jgi:hypothetical protein
MHMVCRKSGFVPMVSSFHLSTLSAALLIILQAARLMVLCDPRKSPLALDFQHA